MPNYTVAQRERIKTVVLELYLLNVRGTEDICRFLSREEGISLSRRQVERYVAEIKTDLKANAKIDREEMVGRNLARLEDLYRRCIKDEKYQTALGTIREISETLGLKVQPKDPLGIGETLEDWLKKAGETWPTQGASPDAGRPEGGTDAGAVSETNH